MNHKRTHISYMNLLVIFLSALFCLTALRTAGHTISTHAQFVQVTPEPASLTAEGNIKTGVLGQGPEKRQQEPNQVVEEGMLAFSINATPSMKNGVSTANLLVESPPDSGERFTITIRRNDTGEAVYRSGYLDPEQYVDDIPLDVVLLKGEYARTAYFDAYRIDDNAYIGSAGAKVKLYALE